MTVTQPRVPVTGGRSALLPCRLEEGEAAQVTWYREGVAVKANLSAEAVMFGQYYVIYQAGRWYNLSIGEYARPQCGNFSIFLPFRFYVKSLFNLVSCNV